MIQAGRRIKEAGIILSVTVLLGLGGREKVLTMLWIRQKF